MRSPAMAAAGLLGMLLGPVVAASSAVVLPNTHDLLLRSQDGKHEYRVMIAGPDLPAPAGGYPSIFVLDGNGVFGAVRDEVRREVAETYHVPAVIVAIGYPGEAPWNDVRRDHDLTPAVPGRARIAGPGGQVIPDTGGADAFLAFIQGVVKPAVQALYPLDPRRQTLMGHSFGGLFTLHTLFTHPDAFQTYVAMSPSIWFADGYILEEEAAYRARYAGHPDQARLLITVGGCEQTAGECDPGMHSTPARDAWLTSRGRMVDNAREMQARLAAVRRTATQLRVIEGEHHVSVIGASLARAVRFALVAVGDPGPAAANDVDGAMSK